MCKGNPVENVVFLIQINYKTSTGVNAQHHLVMLLQYIISDILESRPKIRVELIPLLIKKIMHSYIFNTLY